MPGLVLLGAMAIPVLAAEREIGSAGELTVFIDGSWSCDPEVALQLDAPVAAMYDLEPDAVQNIVSNSLLVLGFECPDIVSASVAGRADEVTVFTAEAQKATSWALTITRSPLKDELARVAALPLSFGALDRADWSLTTFVSNEPYRNTPAAEAFDARADALFERFLAVDERPDEFSDYLQALLDGGRDPDAVREEANRELAVIGRRAPSDEARFGAVLDAVLDAVPDPRDPIEALVSDSAVEAEPDEPPADLFVDPRTAEDSGEVAIKADADAEATDEPTLDPVRRCEALAAYEWEPDVQAALYPYEIDIEPAMAACLEAADMDEGPASAFRAGRVLALAGNVDEAAQYWLEAANDGYAPGAHAYARWLIAQVVDTDANEGPDPVDMLDQLVADGYPPAAATLGQWLIERAEDVESALAGAELLQAAAEVEVSEASYWLGRVWEEGLLDEVDLDEAALHYADGAALGDLDARASLARLLIDAATSDEEYAQAFDTAAVAADYGHPESLALVGWLYENGWGTDRDQALALELYRLAASAGNAFATERLAESEAPPAEAKSKVEVE